MTSHRLALALFVLTAPVLIARDGTAIGESVALEVWSRDALMVRGERVYRRTCWACHGPDGEGLPGNFPPLVASEVVAGPVSLHVRAVARGRDTGRFPAPMPPFGTRLSDLDIAAVVTFERNSFGHGTGDVVQPADVKAAR